MNCRKSTPYLYAIPAILLLIVFKLYPVLSSVFNSLFGYRSGIPNVFVGLDNYVKLFSDPVFFKSLSATAIFNLIVNPLQVALAFISALVFNKNVKGLKLLRTIYYIPFCLSLVIATILWSVMLNPSQGLINSFLKMLSLPSQPFLTSKDQAMMCIVLISTWKGVAYWMMFFLAGLQGIPESIYEACRIDGASPVRTLFHMTIPLMKNVFQFVIISDFIANMLLFAPMYIQTNGGPQMSTNVLMFEAFKSAYSYLDYGRSYTITTVLLLIIGACVAGIQFAFRNKDTKEVYS